MDTISLFSKQKNLKPIEIKLSKLKLIISYILDILKNGNMQREQIKIHTVDYIFIKKNLSTLFHAATDIKLEGNFIHYAVVCRFLRRFCFFPHQWLHYNKGLCLLPVSYVLSSFQCLA